jgi:hypothetical protein
MRRILPIVAALLVACTATATPTPTPTSQPTSGPTATPSPGATPPPTPGPTPVEPTDGLGPFICQYPYAVDGSVERAQITDVRGGAHAGYDRIVFQFAGGPPAAVPTVEIRVGTPPFTQDPSGLPLSVSGSSFLIIVLRGGTGLDPDGVQTYSGETDFPTGFPVLQHLVQAGDFEALSEWVAGLTGPACIRMTVLANPSRLVIDLAAQ